MDFWGITDRGKVRQKNQDAYFICYDEEKAGAILVVCDGMGGAKAGNVASTLALETYLDVVKKELKVGNTSSEIADVMKEAVSVANDAVYQQSISEIAYEGMGTTLVAAVITDQIAAVINIGDSRAYHITKKTITQITRDHSVVEDMIGRGDLTRDEAKKHPSKNLITRALGTCSDIEPDLFFPKLRKGEYLLLCSDGLSNMVTEQELLCEVLRSDQKDLCCQRLLDIAIARGAPDNVTVIIFEK